MLFLTSSFLLLYLFKLVVLLKTKSFEIQLNFIKANIFYADENQCSTKY